MSKHIFLSICQQKLTLKKDILEHKVWLNYQHKDPEFMDIFTHIYYCQGFHKGLELRNKLRHRLSHCNQQKIRRDMK